MTNWYSGALASGLPIHLHSNIVKCWCEVAEVDVALAKWHVAYLSCSFHATFSYHEDVAWKEREKVVSLLDHF